MPMDVINLKDFHISEKTGFLLENPLQELPEYFKAWNYLAQNLVNLTKNKQLRQKVKQIPVLDYSRLSTYREQRLAHLQLSLIAACYIWQDGDSGVPQILPRSIALPWWGVSKVLGIKPILNHPSLALANWKLVDPERPITIENLRCIYCLPGGREAEWFCIATCNVEYEFAKGLQHLISAINSAESRNEEQLIESLRGIKHTLTNMKSALARMHDELSAETFYNVVRPFLAGWGGVGSPLPDGLIYEGVSEEPYQMIGGSAAQSSTLQSLDAALNVIHVPDVKEFLITMREYMPPSHRKFIEEIEKRTKIKQFVMENRQCEALQIAFNDCLAALVDFRSYHIQIVTKYIVVASKKKDSSYNYDSVADKGTGGTSILPFLKSIRESAVQQTINKG